jgi:hypothetical protein
MLASNWDAVNDAASTTANSPVRINVLANDLLGSAGLAGNTITVRVSGDQYKGTAADPYPRFNLLVDGKVIGSGAVTTNHNTGGWQDIAFKADALVGSSGNIGVQFYNDAWGGSTGGDRNLHIDSIKVNDKAFEPSTEHLYMNGTATLNVGSQLGTLLKQPATTSTMSIAGGPANGAAVVNADKTITYTPKAGFSGTDSFGYKLTDAAGLSDTATVAVSVASGPVTPPPAGTGHYTTQHYVTKTSGYSDSYGGRKFFIDPASGASGNNGTTEGSSWKSVDDAERFAANSGFEAGDAVFFKRGHTYDTKTGFNINGEGTADKPVVFGAYGNGAPPKLTNSNFTPDGSGNDTSIWDSVLNVNPNASYVTIRDMSIGNARAGNIFESGILVNGDHIIVDNVDITGAGIGVVFGGTPGGSSKGEVKHSYIHDLSMVVNTAGGDDDYGSIGVMVTGTSDIAIRDNTFKNIKASSHDYGQDGSILEGYGTVRNVALEGNYIENALCVTEFGGNSSNSVANVSIDHNVIVNTDNVAVFHNGTATGFGLGSISNVDFTSNTVHSTLPNSPNTYSAAFGFSGANGSFLDVKNNIFEIAAMDRFDVGATNYTHTNNLYDLGAVPTTAGHTTAVGEYRGDPAFVNAGARDFHLTAGSGALSKAVPIAGHLTDYAEVNLVGRPNLDIGAVEFMG